MGKALMKLKKEEQWENLTLGNDFIFGKVMENPKLCKTMLERLLKLKIRKLEYPERQKSIEITLAGKGIRLDIYVEDDENTVYNVEIQRINTKELAKRSRYYQGLLDLQMIEKGVFYSELKKTYIIFLCSFDMFGQGYHQYTFQNCCMENKDIVLGDESYKIFFNTKGTTNDVSVEVKAFLNYLEGILCDDDYIQELEKEVKKIKYNKKWRKEYMTLQIRDYLNRQDGYELGIQQGIQIMVETLKELGLSSQQILQKVNEKYHVSEVEIKKYME